MLFFTFFYFCISSIKFSKPRSKLFFVLFIFSSFFILFSSLFFATISRLRSCFLFFRSSIAFCFCSSANCFSFSIVSQVLFELTLVVAFLQKNILLLFFNEIFFPFFKFQVEIVSVVYSPFFNKSTNLRIDGCINKLKDLLVINQFL